jgi:hypothetical protein
VPLNDLDYPGIGLIRVSNLPIVETLAAMPQRYESAPIARGLPRIRNSFGAPDAPVACCRRAGELGANGVNEPAAALFSVA